jgi:hypothetical protein
MTATEAVDERCVDFNLWRPMSLVGETGGRPPVGEPKAAGALHPRGDAAPSPATGDMPLESAAQRTGNSSVPRAALTVSSMLYVTGR